MDAGLPIASLPIQALLLTVVGLALWAAGRKLLRPAVAAAALLLGGVTGLVAATTWDLGVSPWIAAAVLGLLLASLAVVLYRFALAAALAVILAVSAPLTVYTAAGVTGDVQALAVESGGGDEAAGETPPEAAEASADDPATFFFKRAIEHELGLGERGAAQVERARGRAREVVAAAEGRWERAPASLRPVLTGACAIGALAGFMLGAMAPAASAAMVTAFGGALMWMSGLGLLLPLVGAGFSSPDGGAGGPGLVTIALWLIMSLLGLAIQWTFRGREADKAG